MTEREPRLGLSRFLRRATPALAALSALLSLVFATWVLRARPGGSGAAPAAAVAAVVLLVLAGAEVVVASRLARLEPKAWTLGLATFLLATVASLAILLVEPRPISGAYLLANLTIVATIHRMRPLYSPDADERQRALTRLEDADRVTRLERLRQSGPAREVVLFVTLVLLAATVTFSRGVTLYFQPDSLSTTVGTAYVGFALLQLRACYGLWLGTARGWVLAMLLCSLATLVAAYHALAAEDVVSFAIVLFEAANVGFLYRMRGRYVGEIAVGRPPE